MTKSNEKVTPEVIEFSIADKKKQFNAVYDKRCKKAGEYKFPLARAIYKAVNEQVDNKIALTKGDIYDCYTSLAVGNGTPNQYYELELAGDMLKIDMNKAKIKYLQDCINSAGLLALGDESLPYYYKKPEHRKSLQNGGLKGADRFLEMKMLPVTRVPSNKGKNKTADAKSTYLLPSVTGNDIAITEVADENWFFTLEKDIKTGFFLDAGAMAELKPAKLKMLENLDIAFWIEVHARIRAKELKFVNYESYIKAQNDKQVSNS